MLVVRGLPAALPTCDFPGKRVSPFASMVLLFLEVDRRKIAFCFFHVFHYNTGVELTKVFAFVAQLVERSLGKTEVSGPIPDKGSVRLF